MAAPRKPWERPGVNYHRISPVGGQRLTSNSNFGAANQFPFGGGAAAPQSMPATRANSNIPPALPPLAQSSFVSSYGSGGYSPYSSYGSYGMYGSPFATSYGGYGAYGRYGYSTVGMSPYGGAITDNAFIQMAEESSRPAFESIEAVVHAVGSVSMMLESTYHAMYSSFRAVIGVAHHFSRMKTQFAQILSAFAVIRSLRWLYRKILYLMGIRKINPMADEIWSTVSQQMSTAAESLNENDIKRNRSNWPIIMFLVVVFGAPWVIWRLLISVTGAHTAAAKQWISGEGPHYLAVAQYDLVGQSEQMLSFKAGQTIRLAPKELQPRMGCWLLGTIDGKKTGLVPTNYIQVLRKSVGTILQQQHSSPPPERQSEKSAEHPAVMDQGETEDQCNFEQVAVDISDNPPLVND